MKESFSKETKTLNELYTFFEKLLCDDPNFCGSCEVNFFKGSVPHVNIKKSVKFKPKGFDGDKFT